MATTIIIGRKELFSFAERYSSRRLVDYSGLADGEVLCCLFNLVFPELRLRPAAPQTHSSTQRGHVNWELLFRRFARLRIPLDFLQPSALQQNSVECGFSTLVLFYFLHHLSKRADFSAEFALDVAEDVTAYLQSTDCIASLLLGNALSWSAIPEALLRTVQDHPAFHTTADEAVKAEEAAVELYRRNFTRRQRRPRTGSRHTSSSADSFRSSNGSQHRQGARATSTTKAGENVVEVEDMLKRRGEGLSSPRAEAMQRTLQQVARNDTAAASSSPEAARSAPYGEPNDFSRIALTEPRLTQSSPNAGSGQVGRVKATELEGSPLPRAPSHGPSARSETSQHRQQRRHSHLSSANGSYRNSASRASSTASSHSSSSTVPSENEFDSSLEGSGVQGSSTTVHDLSRRPPPSAFPRASSPSAQASSAEADRTNSSSSSVVSMASSHTSRHTQRQKASQQRLSSASLNDPHTSYRAAPSVERRHSSSSSLSKQERSAMRTPSPPSLDVGGREDALEAALRAKEEECEALQMRVAQLLSLLANVKATAMAAAPAHPHQQREEPSTQPPPPPAHTLRAYEQRMEELEAQLPAHKNDASDCSSPERTAADVEADIRALTADVVDEETGGTIDVNATANLLHCLLLECLHDSPRNREQMQKWLWSIVAAHHTVQGRLLAAVELLRTTTQRRRGRAVSPAPSSSAAAASPAPSRPSKVFRVSPDTTAPPRSQSTVAAPFVIAGSTSSSSVSPSMNSVRKGEEQASAAASELAHLRTVFYAELERLHDREHALQVSLQTSEAQCAATVQRAVRRERLWKQLCAEVYAAEQASFYITECSVADEVETCLRQRDVHYGNVERLTQQLVEDREEEMEKEGCNARHVTQPEMEKKRESCASLQALITHLKDERAELLGDVTRLQDLVTEMQQERAAAPQTFFKPRRDSLPSAERGNGGMDTAATVGSRPSQLPVPPAFRPLFHSTASTTDATNSEQNSSALHLIDEFHSRAAGFNGGATRPLARGLSSLLRDEKTVYPVA